MAIDSVNDEEVIMAVRQNLPQNVWHHLTGGAESETTMCRNRSGLDSPAFLPRALVDVSNVDATTIFLDLSSDFRDARADRLFAVDNSRGWSRRRQSR